MRFWLGPLLLACNSAAPAAPAAPPAVAATQITAAARSAARPVAERARAPRTAAHGAEIVALAVTPDGAAVASVDRLGGVRLWPALDGTREPVVIRGGASRAITIARDGDGFVIGTLDAAGGVRLVRTGADGAPRGQVTVASAQPASQIESTSEGLVILWADQAITLVDAAGAERARLTPEPGSHVDSLVARDDHVLALVLEDKQLHGRWIVVDHGARWGGDTPVLAGKLERTVLSPDGKLLAVSHPRSLHPAVIDLATGVARKTPLCVARAWPHEDGGEADDREFLRGNNPPVPVGFLSATVVACSVLGSLTWWNLDGTPADVLTSGVSLAQVPAAISPNGMVVGNGPSLALATTSTNVYLGYGLHDVAAMRIGPGGVVIGGEQHSFVLDGALRERAALEIGRNRSDWTDLVPLDERYAATLATHRLSSHREANQLAVFDGVTRTARQVLPYELGDKPVAYEPATHLLLAGDTSGALVFPYDPASHRFGAPSRLAGAINASRVALLDPRQAGGLAALELDATNAGVLVGELAPAELAPGAVIQPRTSYRVPGELRGVDRAGRLYLHRPEDHDDVVIFTRDRPGARLPGAAALTLRPNADGSLIAAFDGPRVKLFTAAGALRWDVAHWSASELGWSPDGQLVVQLASAVATLDLATGALAERRCGLGFGLSDTPHDSGRGGASVCD